MQRDKDKPTTQETAEMVELEKMIRDEDHEDRVKSGEQAAKHNVAP